MIRLLITPDAAEHPLMHSFDTPVVSIGTAPDNVLPLTGVGISKHHLILRELGETIEVEDLGGSNGTYLNGKRVHGRHLIAPGDVLLIPGHGICVAEGVKAAETKRPPAANPADFAPIGDLVTRRAAAWHERPDASLLLAGSELAETLRWRAAIGEGASAASQRELAFIAASTQAARSHRGQALRGFLGVGLACALGLLGSQRVLAGGVDAYSQSIIASSVAKLEESTHEARRKMCLTNAREVVNRVTVTDDPEALATVMERLACASEGEREEKTAESEIYDQLEKLTRGLLRASQGRLLTQVRSGVTGEVIAADPSRCAVVWGDSSGEVHAWNRCEPARSVYTVKSSSPIRALTVTVDARAFSIDDAARLRSWPFDGGGGGVRPLPLTGARTSPGAAAISDNGRFVALAAADEASLQLYDLTRGEPPFAAQSLGGLTSATLVIAFVPDESGLLAIDGDRLLAWNLRGRPGKPRTLASHRASIGALRVASCRPEGGPEQLFALTGSADGDVQVHPLTRGSKATTFHAASAPILQVTITSDCRHLLAGSPRSVEVWELARPGSPRMIALDQPLTALASMPEGHLVAAATGDEVLLIDPIASDDPLRIARRGALRTLLSTGEAGIIAAYNDGSVRASDLLASAGAASTRASHPGPVRAAALDSDGRRLLSASANTAYLWALDSGETRRIGVPLPAEATITAVALSERGDWVATAGDHELNLWFVGQEQPTRYNFSFDGRATALAFSAPWLALGSTNGAAYVDLRAPDERKLQQLQDDEVSALAFIPGSAQLALGGVRATLGLVDLNAMFGGHGKTSQNHAKGRGITEAIVASPDGRWFAAGGEQGDLRIWKAPWENKLTGPVGVVHAVAASPDGRLLAAAGDEATIHIFNVEDTAMPAQRLDLGDTTAPALAFAASNVLVSGGSDGVVRRWSLASPDREGSLLTPDRSPPARMVEIGAHGPAITGLLVTPDGHQVLSIADDPTIHVWPLTRQQLYEVAALIVGAG